MFQAPASLFVVMVSTLDHIDMSTVSEFLDGVVTIEQRGGLFERATFGLDSEKVDVAKLDCEPDGVDQIVYRADYISLISLNQEE